jgi:hypothetical protein
LADNEKNALFEVLASLMVVARLRQEIGEFIKADLALDEVKEILLKN